ncbi:hypothetical protein NBRC10512_003715 [Rhodotorula toruloides]|uniref:Uncharacterized protein n=1 Tax=Rhodotorula toruloides (strain NP11) TaxID=1130832 RepID=M7WX47_RHOT1|nr:uncharacterized protein RHTO_00709 [Rhodotorula toruloides NP11]EMS22430.1 hypothetical protein RHTO_00709 [Rhodotorula toruloides NP11]
MSGPSQTLPTADEVSAASSVTILDSSGNELPLSTLFQNEKGGKADYVSFLSHKLAPSSLAASNIKLSIVGCGDHKFIENYRKQLDCPFEIYADPSKKAYEALGMTHRTLDLGDKAPEYAKGGMVSNVVGSIASAFKMGRFTSAGDIKQLGGEFVFERGQVVWCHRMANTRDHAPFSELSQAMGINAQ